MFDSLQHLKAHWKWHRCRLLICRYDGCNTRFSYSPELIRHLKIHDPNCKRFPCPRCRKRSGSNGFKRKDHLHQHLRNYHNEMIEKREVVVDWVRCCKPECPEVQANGARPLLSGSEHTKHLRTVHDESPFECPQPLCERIGGKGYFRQPDLKKHLERVHPECFDPVTGCVPFGLTIGKFWTHNREIWDRLPVVK